MKERHKHSKIFNFLHEILDQIWTQSHLLSDLDLAVDHGMVGRSHHRDNVTDSRGSGPAYSIGSQASVSHHTPVKHVQYHKISAIISSFVTTVIVR